MPEKKEIFGAFILPPKRKKLFRTSGEYAVYIGKLYKSQLKKGEMFTTNPEINEQVALIFKRQQLEGKIKIGFVEAITPGILGKKIVRIGQFYPLTGSEEMPVSSEKFLKGLGLASRIEMRILMYLEKKFPRCRVITQQSTALFPREQMLRKRGSWQNKPFGQPANFDVEIGRIARYIGSHAPSVKRRAQRKPL